MNNKTKTLAKFHKDLLAVHAAVFFCVCVYLLHDFSKSDRFALSEKIKPSARPMLEGSGMCQGRRECPSLGGYNLASVCSPKSS